MVFYIVDKSFVKSLNLIRISSESIQIQNIKKSVLKSQINTENTSECPDIGDIIYKNNENQFWTLYYTPNKCYNCLDNLKYLDLPNSFYSKFCSFRSFYYIFEDFSILLCFSILEKCLLENSFTIMDKLIYKFPNNSDLLNYFKNLTTTKHYEEGIFEIFRSFFWVKELSRIIVCEYQSNYIKICEDLDLSIRIINAPDLQVSYFNSGGKRKLFYLNTGNDCILLYKLSQNLELSSYSTINFKMSSVKLKSRKGLFKEAEMKKNAAKSLFLKSIEIYSNCSKLNEFITYFHQFAIDDAEFTNFLRCKLCMFCCSSSNIVNLDCNHAVCQTDLIKLYENNSYLNMIVYYKEVSCSYTDCNHKIQAKFFEDQFPEIVRYYCINCSNYKQKNQMNTSCKCLCDECAVIQIREKSYECPIHKLKLTESELHYYRSLKMSCYGCENTFSWIKYFHKICMHNLCCECILEINCQKCFGDCPINMTHIELIKIPKMTCICCKGVLMRKEPFYLYKTCECAICADCQLKNTSPESTLSCIECKAIFDETIINNLRKRIQDIRDMPIKQCIICLENFRLNEIISLGGCVHEVCKKCFNLNAEALIQDINTLYLIDKCPESTCRKFIPPEQLTLFLNPEIYHKWEYYSIYCNFSIVECPRCKFKFESSYQNKAVCMNTTCTYEFCKKCLNDYHAGGNCEEVYLQERVKEMIENNPDGVTQCPRCRWPYLKDPIGCEHVDCINQDCKASFCFVCACMRSPTTIHGNHYHRKACRFFSNYGGEDDAYDERCSECLRERKLCSRPKDLRTNRLVEPDEAV